MAQPSSVAREPSMEEILASIRRIIEDSEPAAAARIEPSKGAGEAEEFKAELTFPKEAPQAELTPVEAERPRSMAEIQAALRKEQPAAPAQVHPLRPAADAALPRQAAQPAKADAPRAELVARPPQQPQPASQAPAAKTQEDRPMAEPAPALRPSIDAAPAPRAAQPEASRQVAAAAPAARAEAARGTLMSDRSGKQVNASFGELAEAYQLVRKRSLADAAEDIMRPMLQEWLDNNLPRIVERLVREEIERVARGNDD